VCLPGLDQAYALFCTLDDPIDFDSIDNKPVDLIFTIITPPATGSGSGGPLSYLAAVSRLLRDDGVASALRNADNPWSAYDIVGKFSPASGQPVN
jgi:PTS system nitrogen regulatory IIA component